MRVKKKYLQAILALVLVLVVPMACQEPVDNEPEVSPGVQRSVVSAEDIPGVVHKLQVKLGLPTGVDQFSTAGGAEDGSQQLKIDWDRILQLVDSTGMETYTFDVEDSDGDFSTFYNLILRLNADQQAYQPYLLKYEMDEDFVPVYLRERSFENFSGKLTKIMLNSTIGADRRGSASLDPSIGVDGTVCPNGSTSFSGGSSTPGGSSGGGWTSTNPGSGVEDPDPIAEVVCTTYINYTNWYNSSDGSYITTTYGSVDVECEERTNSAADGDGCGPLSGEIGLILDLPGLLDPDMQQAAKIDYTTATKNQRIVAVINYLRYAKKNNKDVNMEDIFSNFPRYGRRGAIYDIFSGGISFDGRVISVSRIEVPFIGSGNHIFKSTYSESKIVYPSIGERVNIIYTRDCGGCSNPEPAFMIQVHPGDKEFILNFLNGN